MDTTYLNIDFDNEKHVGYIHHLSLKNNFHIDDIKIYLKDEVSKKIKKQPVIGYFVIFGKKVIGFIIGCKSNNIEFETINETKRTLHIGHINLMAIEFLLISKQFQNKGEGTKLINKFKDETIQKGEFIVIKTIIYQNVKKYYEKLGFFESRKAIKDKIKRDLKNNILYDRLSSDNLFFVETHKPEDPYFEYLYWIK